MKTYLRESCGATTIEYALIASLISIVIIAGVQQIGTKLAGFFNIASYL